MSELDTLLGRLRELAGDNDEQHVRIGSDVSLHDLRKANVQIGREIERRAMGVALREIVVEVNAAGVTTGVADDVLAIVVRVGQRLGVQSL